ncbi:hypothetical protein [Chromobacterium phragmitis]|uniref:Uncharacterized protein n=1 Tax=Chromobacterium phragmitis TaxID=2202141 RepID=A0ABV0J0J1_9NEIS
MLSYDQFADSVLAAFQAFRAELVAAHGALFVSPDGKALLVARERADAAFADFVARVRAAAGEIADNAARTRMAAALVGIAGRARNDAQRGASAAIIGMREIGAVYTDRLGRIWEADRYVRTVARRAAVEDEVARAAAQSRKAVARYPDPTHRNEGLVIDLASVEQVRQVMHPNTNARLHVLS